MVTSLVTLQPISFKILLAIV